MSANEANESNGLGRWRSEWCSLLRGGGRGQGALEYDAGMMPWTYDLNAPDNDDLL